MYVSHLHHSNYGFTSARKTFDIPQVSADDMEIIAQKWTARKKCVTKTNIKELTATKEPDANMDTRAVKAIRYIRSTKFIQDRLSR